MNGGRRSVKPLPVIANNNNGSLADLIEALNLLLLAPSRTEIRLGDARGRHS
jgi:hypothetical protein